MEKIKVGGWKNLYCFSCKVWGGKMKIIVEKHLNVNSLELDTKLYSVIFPILFFMKISISLCSNWVGLSNYLESVDKIILLVTNEILLRKFRPIECGMNFEQFNERLNVSDSKITIWKALTLGKIRLRFLFII